MKFSIIIPTYNDWPRLMKCLKALENQTLSRDLFEVIVVNNNKEETIPAGFYFPEWAQIIHEPKPGSYAARNEGAEISVGEILAFTDSDCIPNRNWLANAENHFEELDCDLVGGKVEIFKTDNGDKYGYLYERLNAFHQHENVPKGKGVTANLFITKTVFEKVGGFDSAIKSGGDWEFTLRCTDMGYRMIYAEDVAVLHPARNLAAIFKKQYRLTCGGAANTKEKYGHSHLRMLGSHLLHGFNYKRGYLSRELSKGDKMVILSIDLLKYLYRSIIFGGLLLRLIDPNKVRE